jgi:hypothetical protein
VSERRQRKNSDVSQARHERILGLSLSLIYKTGAEQEGTISGDSYGSPPPSDSAYNANYPPAGRFYPETNEFPPPPTATADQYAHPPGGYQQPAPYNPADYAHPPGVTQQPYGYTPPPPQTADPYLQDARYRRGDENVSAEPAFEHSRSGASPAP